VTVPIASAWNLLLTYKRGAPWVANLCSALLLTAALIFLWVAIAFHLIGLSTRY